MSRHHLFPVHDLDTAYWEPVAEWVWGVMIPPRNTGRGAHRAAYEPSAWTDVIAGQVDVYGLRRNETTRHWTPSRLVGK